MTYQKGIDINFTPIQQEWLTAVGTEMLVGGAAGPGKSWFIRASHIFWATQIPNLQTYIFRRTFPDLYNNHLTGPTSLVAMLAPLIESKHVKFDQRNNVFTFWNGSQIHLGYCQYENDWTKFQGAEIHLLSIDELTHWTKSLYLNLRTRVRMTNIEIPKQWKHLFPRIINATNPGGVGHNWVKQYFVDMATPKKAVAIPDNEGGMIRQYMPARLTDNPHMKKFDPQYENRLKSASSPEMVRAMLEGDWNIVSGGMLDDVWSAKYNVLKPFTIPQNWYVDRCYDYGSAKPWACLWVAESNGEEVEVKMEKDGQIKKVKVSFPKGSVFVIKEAYGMMGQEYNKGDRKDPYEQAKVIHEIDKQFKLNGIKVYPGPADNSIFDGSRGESIADMMDVENVNWTKSDKSPGSRRTGWSKMRSMLKAAHKYPLEEPALYIFDTCVNTIRTLPTLPRDQHNLDDVDTDAEDHIADALRYRITDKGKQPFTTRLAGF
jgi:hypothetical protein